MVWRRGLAALALAACTAAPGALPAPAAGAEVDPFAEYASLAQEQLSPAPLVPVTMPAILGGGLAAPPTVLTDAKGVYSLAFNHFFNGHRVDASILLQNLGNRTVPGRRQFFGPLYAYKPTRVRGHKGLALRARFSPVRSLVWREDGRLYELSTNTPKTIGTGVLRAVANGLQHLLGAYTAQVISADGGQQKAEVLLAEHVVGLGVSWVAPCTQGGVAAHDRGATAQLGWLALGAAGAFARAPLAVPGLAGTAPWTFQASGSAAVDGGQVTFQASSAAGAEACSIGPLSLPLARLPLLQRF